jgi:hypothetical protein
VEFVRSKDVRPRFIVGKSGESRMHRQERPVSGKAAPGLNHRNDEADNRKTEGENLLQQPTGFIDHVFNIVHRVLQKHEIPAFDPSSDGSEGSSASIVDTKSMLDTNKDAKKDVKKTGAEAPAPVGLTSA